ncbi:MAG: hypothetical protein MK073_07205, partial [Phycisphaerales bacterium]|nr:hypothetical protein [Phycisphaerales bacterium]
MKSTLCMLSVLSFTATAVSLSGIAAADVVMDQIGDMDGSAIDPSNILASQIFEEGFAQYNIIVADGFTGDGGSISMVEMVMSGWNGFTDPTLVTAISANLYSSPDAAGADLNGDIASQTIDAADAEISADWGGEGTFLFIMNTELSSIVGDNFIGLAPYNEFGANGQTGICITTIDGGADAFQANPAGGF